MIQKLNNFFESFINNVSSGSKNLYHSFQNKDTIKKLVLVICVLLLLIGIAGLTGFLILSIYRFIDSHMGELMVIAISIGAIFAWWQSGRDQREAKRRKALEERYRTLMPKANAIYEKVGIFLTDIFRDKSLSSLMNLAKPTNISNIIIENPDQRIQIKPDGSGYLLSYRADKLSIGALEEEQIFTIRDVLQGAINQRISAYGINGLCPPKQNTFLYIMDKPTDSHTYISICLDYDEQKVLDSYTAAPVLANIAVDKDYGW